MHYYKRNIGDYAKKAGHLSMLEHGAYTLIMDAYYDREKGLTRQEALRVARARTDDEIAAVDTVLSEFFAVSESLYVQKRIEEELLAFRQRQATNRSLGAKGGEAKAKRIATESLSEHVANDKPNHKPLTINQELKEESPIGDLSPASPIDPAETIKIAPDPIPYQRIVDAYNATLTKLPKVREVTQTRKTAIRSAWQASQDRRTLGFWTAYFEECADDPFLNGTGPYTNGHENWRPDFDYLMRTKTITRAYERALDRLERHI